MKYLVVDKEEFLKNLNMYLSNKGSSYCLDDEQDLQKVVELTGECLDFSAKFLRGKNENTTK